MTHYMHIMHAHPEWLLGNGFASAAALTTSGNEKRHSLDKRMLLRKTMHGMVIEVNGQKITHAPAIYQLFLWSYRMVQYQLWKQEKSLTVQQWQLDVWQLRALQYAYDVPQDALWDANLLDEYLSIPRGMQIYLTGRARQTLSCSDAEDEIGFPIKIHVWKISRVAAYKIEQAGGQYQAAKVTGKAPVALQDRTMVDRSNKRKQDMLLDRASKRLAADGYKVPTC